MAQTLYNCTTLRFVPTVRRSDADAFGPLRPRLVADDGACGQPVDAWRYALRTPGIAGVRVTNVDTGEVLDTLTTAELRARLVRRRQRYYRHLRAGGMSASGARKLVAAHPSSWYVY